MALLITPIENSAMVKRGPYQKSRPKPEPPPWRRNFIAEWRGVFGWTQEKLAEKAGLSVGTISVLEGRTAGFSDESLHKIAGALGVERGMVLDVNPQGDEDLWSVILRANAEQRRQIARHAGVIVPAKKRPKQG